MIQRQITVNAERFLASRFGKIAPAVDFLRNCELSSLKHMLSTSTCGTSGFDPIVRYVVSSEMPHGCWDFRGVFNSPNKVRINVEKTHEFAQSLPFDMETGYAIVQAHELKHAHDQIMTKLGMIWDGLTHRYADVLRMPATDRTRAITNLTHEIAIVEGVFDGRAVFLTSRLAAEMAGRSVDMKHVIPPNASHYAAYAHFVGSIEAALGEGVWGVTERMMPATYSEFSNPQAYISRVTAMDTSRL